MNIKDDKNEETKDKDERNDREESYYMEILTYYKKIKSMILSGSLLDDEQSCETLVERIIEDMKKKDVETFLLTDQRCSKIFELMLSINILCIKRLIDTIRLNNVNMNESLEEDEKYRRLKNCITNYIFILKSIFREIENNIFDLYGSHVTETALESAVILISFLNEKRILEQEKNIIKQLIMDSLGKLNNNVGWLYIITNSSASHVGRTIINICVGKVNMCIDNMEEYILDNVGRRNQANKLRFNGKGQNKYKNYRCEAIDDFQKLLLCENDYKSSSSISGQFVQALINDLEGIINDTYALPSLIILCKTLNECEVQNSEYINIINVILTLLITNGQEIEDIITGYKEKLVNFEKISRLFINLTENCIKSNLKSRLLEAILDIIPYEFLQIWISSQTIAKQNGEQIPLNNLLDSEYGHFIILNLLRNNRIKSEEFISILKNLDFFKLITEKKYIDIIIALMDTCRRLQCEYKYLTRKLWKSIEIETSDEYQYTFSCIIFLSKKNTLNLRDKEAKRNLEISSQGCLMISSLSKFPVDTIHPLVSGITYFINNYKNTMLEDILETSYGIRMTETILSPSSNIPQTLKKRWIQSYMGNFLKLTLSGTCNYAIIAMFYASDHFYRKLIIEELLNEQEGGGKDVIMSRNFKIFKILKIESFNKKDNWENINNKIDKTRRLFSNIIDEKIELFEENNEIDNPEKLLNLNKINNNKKNKKNRKSIDNSDDVVDEKSIGSIIQHIKNKKSKIK